MVRNSSKFPVPAGDTKEIAGIWDVGNPKSIHNLMHDSLANAIVEAQMNRPDLFIESSEDEMRKLYKGTSKRYPSTVENQLRLRFWQEYDWTLSEGRGRKIAITAVCRGVCDVGAFWRASKNPLFLAWLCCPPISYTRHLEEILSLGAFRMREILKVDPVDAAGNVNVKLAAVQAQIHQAAELRIHGAVAQKNLNVNYSENHTTHQIQAEDASAVLIDKVSDLEKSLVNRERVHARLEEFKRLKEEPIVIEAADPGPS